MTTDVTTLIGRTVTDQHGTPYRIWSAGTHTRGRFTGEQYVRAVDPTGFSVELAPTHLDGITWTLEPAP